MKSKNVSQICFQLLIVIGLLVANTSTSAAGGGKGGNDHIIGQVSSSVTNDLPTPTAEELEKLGIMLPDANQPLPSGGTATAIANLTWNNVTMSGKAISQLSSDTIGTYSICATATQLYMNGSPQGGAGQVCAAKTGGGSVTSTKSKTVLNVHGITWRVDTNHAFTKSGWAGWFPSLTVSATP